MIRVLVVDDDFMVAKVHAGFIERTDGFTVAAIAHTGAQALQATERERPDLVLLDIHLPDVGGLELLQRLRQIVPDLDVLIISAAREADTVRRALRGGIVHYLMKPFSGEDLRTRLEHYRQAYGNLAGRSDTAAQDDIDKVFGIGVAAEPPLPKGFSAETLRLVEACLRDAASDLSALEAAERLGVSRVSARRYLEHLASAGKVEVRLRYGEVGRPERRYAWANG